MDLLNRMLYLN